MKIYNMMKTNAEPSNERSVAMAMFTAEFRGFAMNGCAILRKWDGFLDAVAPSGKRQDGRAFWFKDDDLRAEFKATALAAYAALEDVEEDDAAGVMRFLEVAA